MQEKINQVDARDGLQLAEENFELFCDGAVLLSKALFVTYEKLVEVGFSKTEALEIVKARGINL